MARLPQPGGDNGNWGTILNEYLSEAHQADGSLKPGIPQSKIQNLTSDLASKVNATDLVHQGLTLNRVNKSEFKLLVPRPEFQSQSFHLGFSKHNLSLFEWAMPIVTFT
ncbi:MAG: hypothetical protein WAW80_04545 [Candidatus Saccharimonadales bacterium]